MLVYWVWLALLTELSLREKLTLLTEFTDPEELYNSSHPAAKLGDMLEAEQVIRKCKRMGIDIITLSDPAFPQRLRNISAPPLLLYCKGVLPDMLTHPVIGVVGTRKASTYGNQIAVSFGRQISECGGIVVSGGADGVDSSALKGAVEAGGPVVTVLACGVDVVYPRSNRRLFMDVEEKGCLLSEYPPGTEPKRWHFPHRNRIISGLSDGVLIVEAPEKSGAMITAREAIAQNRDVFVVPGNIDVTTCKGSNSLLREGACAVFSGWDVLKDYAPRYPDTVRETKPVKVGEPLKVAQSPVPFDKKVVDKEEAKPYSVFVDNDHPGTQQTELTEEERQLLSCIDRKATSIDDVAAMANQPTASVLRILTKMAMRGLVIMHPGKLVSRK